jgi:alkylation response protein AidB-like acyl-CoA dehydrogenase
MRNFNAERLGTSAGGAGLTGLCVDEALAWARDPGAIARLGW